MWSTDLPCAVKAFKFDGDGPAERLIVTLINKDADLQVIASFGTKARRWGKELLDGDLADCTIPMGAVRAKLHFEGATKASKTNNEPATVASATAAAAPKVKATKLTVKDAIPLEAKLKRYASKAGVKLHLTVVITFKLTDARLLWLVNNRAELVVNAERMGQVALAGLDDGAESMVH